MAEERGAKIRVIPMNERGELIIDEYENLLNETDKDRRGRRMFQIRSER